MSTPRLTEALADRYRLERELGAGGMATVYLADDLKHGRRVAIKVLRPELAAVLGAERFVQEIRTTAQLQHPNILPLFDSGEAAGFLYYVMPYVEGETLRNRLDRVRQLEVDEAIEIASSAAAALSYAHEHGVIHRDLKPENILLQSGQALVADFGIALAISHAGASRLTETGLSLGTPHYMSPEQAAGDRHIDARSDVYALGCVTYEMLVGDPPHTGSTVQAIMAKALSEKPPSIRVTRDAVPRHVEAAVSKALAKLPADRFSTAKQFADALANPAFAMAMPDSADAPRRSRLAGRLGWPLATLAVAALAIWGWMRPPPPSPVVRSQITLPVGEQLAFAGNGSYPLDISRDGASLVYLGQRGGVRQLFLRALNAFASRPLPGTEGARTPFFSYDGEWVGFFAGQQLQRVPIAGGAPVAIATVPVGRAAGASWGEDDTILFAVGAGLYRVPSAGGEPVELQLVDRSEAGNRLGDDSTALLGTEVMRWPHLLPGGRRALVTVNQGTALVDLAAGEMHHLFAGTQARYLPTGHLIFNAGRERVRLVPFDLGRPAITGPEVPVLENVFRGPNDGAELFAVSQTGTLVYVTGGFERSLWLVDRTGREQPVPVESHGYRFPSVSPDGRKIAVTVDPRPSNIWVIDLLRGSATPLTSDGHNLTPTWAPEGDRLAFARNTNLYWTAWPGGSAPKLLAERPLSPFSPTWGRDEYVVVHEQSAESGADLVVLNVADGSSETLLATDADESLASRSPDGRWIAYTSNVSGVEEIYVMAFPGQGPRHQVSVGGGTDARWSSDGRELFFRNGNRIMAVDLHTAGGLRAGQPHELFAGPYDFTQTNNWDVTPDGRFVMIKGDPRTYGQLHLVTNWFEEIRSR